jgi:hypothetical protein
VNNTYLYAKWKDAPADSPVEYYSEVDAGRWETRKVEIFADGRAGYASAAGSALDTRLAIVPLPAIAEIASQSEFEARPIDASEFEDVWKRATRMEQFDTSKATPRIRVAAGGR